MTSPLVPFKKLGVIFCIVSLGYLILRMLPFDVLIVLSSFAIVTFLLVKSKWKQIRSYGIVNYMSEKAKQILLKKSILDIFSDLLYFPYISQIVKSFAMAVIQKPPPEQLFGCFADLPADARQAIATKGILHLAPSRVENLMLQQDMKNMDPDYGKINTSWYNYKKYEVQEPKRPYKPSLKDKIIKRISEKPWRAIFVLGFVTIVASKRFGKIEIKKILARRGFEMGVILCIISLVPLIMKRHQTKQIKQKRV